MELLEVTEVSMEYNRKHFNQEIIDIENTLKQQSIFSGKVKGHFRLIFNKDIPKSYSFVHLNRALKGVFTQKTTQVGAEHTFNFSTSSIYKLLQEIEYIRAYTKYKNLEINCIEIRIINDFKPKQIENLDSETFINLFEIELSDISASLEMSRVLSGKLNVKYDSPLNNSVINLQKYSSIYNFLENLENFKKEINKNSLKTNISLSGLTDTEVKVRKNQFKRRDEEAQKKF